MPERPSRAPLADGVAAFGTALLVVDMISAWDFPDAGKLAPSAVAIAPKIAALKRRCVRAGIPAIYVNDNRERWRSEFRELAELATTATATGRSIAHSLMPCDADYSVLKPKHSAFFATPLDLLLRHLRVRRLLVTGVAGDSCILLTAAEAGMRDYDVLVPRDCVASLTAPRNARALRMIEDVYRVKTTASTRIRLGRR